EYAARAAALVTALRAVAAGSAKSESVFSAGQQAQHASAALWTVASRELSRLLEIRVAAGRGSRLRALTWSALAWSCAVIIAYFTTRSIRRQLAAVSIDLADGSRQIVTAAGQVASSAQSLSQGASEQ